MNTLQIRSALIQDLSLLRSGKISKAEARARAYLAKQIIDTVKLEMIAAQMNRQGFDPLLLIENPTLAAVA